MKGLRRPPTVGSLPLPLEASKDKLGPPTGVPQFALASFDWQAPSPQQTTNGHETALDLVYGADNWCKSSSAGINSKAPRGRVRPWSNRKPAISNPARRKRGQLDVIELGDGRCFASWAYPLPQGESPGAPNFVHNVFPLSPPTPQPPPSPAHRSRTPNTPPRKPRINHRVTCLRGGGNAHEMGPSKVSSNRHCESGRSGWNSGPSLSTKRSNIGDVRSLKYSAGPAHLG
jgi:hypothetical protein